MINDEGIVSKPIKTLEELFIWSLTDVDPKLMGKALSSAVKKKLKNETKSLVCHDMCGNYLEDRFPDGCNVDSAYYVTQWWYIDIFVYFSHHLVTIPPVGWINAAHAHGVLVLGTFITEFDAGLKICEKFLYDRALIDKVCRILADIALVHQFDGWLLNIENKIESPEIENLMYFVMRLTEICKSKLGKDSLVIWYDSVTINGDLKWQNELNKLNKSFFNLCDGIFLNYNWSEKTLLNTVAEAQGRLTDVFVGVDVFGRGCYGGGGFNCRSALDVVRKYKLSFAIFAPGWVFECQSQSNFEHSQWNFWYLLSPYVECNKIVSLPFQTDFNPGKYYRDNSLFYQLSDQHLQPHWYCSPQCHPITAVSVINDADPHVCPLNLPSPTMRHIYYRDSPGFTFCIRSWADSQVVRLFCCDISLSKNICIKLVCALKKLNNDICIPVGLLITIATSDNQLFHFAYLPPNGSQFDLNVCMNESHFVQLPLESRHKIDEKTIEISAVLPSKKNAQLRSINLIFNDKNSYLSLLKCSVSHNT